MISAISYAVCVIRYVQHSCCLFLWIQKQLLRVKLSFSICVVVVTDAKNIYFVNKGSTGSVAHRSILDIRVYFMLDAQKTCINSHHGLRIRALPLAVNRLPIITGVKEMIAG